MPLAHAELTRAIIGAFFKVFNELGHGRVTYHRYVMGRPGANLPNLA